MAHAPDPVRDDDDRRCRVVLLDEAGDAAVRLDRERFETLAATVLLAEEVPPADLTVLLVSTERSAELHRQHFGCAGPTDVISFPDGSRDPETGRLLLGDIAVCPAIAARLGPDRQTGPPERRAGDELLLYCVHGLLHLLGYEDVSGTDREEMFRVQAELLAASGIAAPAPTDPPLPEPAIGPPVPRPVPAFFCGMAMGTADAVPGVSGGTVALILGFYEGLIGSISDLLTAFRRPGDRGRRRAALRALVFLLPLGAGMGLAVFAALKLLVGHPPDVTALPAEAVAEALAGADGLLIDPSTAPVVFGFFFGLVFCSVREPWRTIGRVRWFHGPLVLAGMGLAVFFSLKPPPGSGSEHPLLLVGAGALAVSVMLLPGVSGTLALLVIGMYQTVAGAISPPRLAILGWFGLGLAVGASVFVPLLKRLLARAHDHTMAVLTGLMAGSLAALWPWKAHYLPAAMRKLGPMTPRPPSGDWWSPVLAMLVGAAVIVCLDRWRRVRVREHRT